MGNNNLTEAETAARLDDWIKMAVEGYNLQQMGDKYGVTRERVRQCLAKVQINTVSIRAAQKIRLAATPITCPYCGKQYLRHEKHWTKGAHRNMVFARSPAQMARDAEMVADYNEGMLVRDIMAKHNTSATMLTRALSWAGQKPDRKKHDSRLPTIDQSIERYEAIAADYRSETLLNEQIAEKYGVSYSLVNLALKRLHAPIPTRSEALRRRARILRKQGLSYRGKKLRD